MNYKRRYHTHRLTLDSANEFHVAMTGEKLEQIEYELFENPETKNLGERGVLCVITRSSGKERVSFLVRDIVTPGTDDVKYPRGQSVQFTGEYRRRAKEKAREVGDDAGLLYIHTHQRLPFEADDKHPKPSGGDLRTARQDLFHDAKQLYDDESVPLAIAVVKDDSRQWAVLGYEFTTPESADQIDDPAYNEDSGVPYYADTIRVLHDDRLEEKPAREEGDTAGVAAPSTPVNIAPVESTANLWGEPAQERIGALRVGLVGLGGGGSILAEHLARMGVGELVLVDYDHIEHGNLNRAQGATRADADAAVPKVEVAGRVARLAATADHFKAYEEYASVTENRIEYGALDRLLDCDIIMHAAEGPWPTQVLDQISHAHLIPLINGGSNLLNDDGILKDTAIAPTMVVSPDGACMECAGYWKEEKADAQSEGEDVLEDDYNMGVETDDERDPSTNSVNLIVAGMMLLRLQDHVLGVSGHQVGIQRFNPGTWEMDEGIDSCSGCQQKEIVAKGDNYQLPLAPDPKFNPEKYRRWKTGNGL